MSTERRKPDLHRRYRNSQTSALHLQEETVAWRKLESTFGYFRTSVWRGGWVLGTVWRTFCIISPWGISLASEIDRASDRWVSRRSWKIMKVLKNSCLRLSYRIPKTAAVSGSVTDVWERKLCFSRSQTHRLPVPCCCTFTGLLKWNRQVTQICIYICS